MKLEAAQKAMDMAEEELDEQQKRETEAEERANHS